MEERLRLYPAKSQRVSKEKDSEIIIDNAISKDFTVIELKTPDRYGLLYKVAQCLSQCEVNIVSAKLSTRVSKAIDIFYVIGPDGEKIVNVAHQEQIRTKVLELLSLNW
jgi:[protein-PII] uridylyltransferase